MKDLEKNVNYDLTNCTDEQLEQVCEWLSVNDSYWNNDNLSRITGKIEVVISFCNEYQGFYHERNYDVTICATTLFETQSDNFDTAYNETIERFKKLGYSIDIIIKGYDK